MTQDERLIPARAGRELDRPLADFATAKPYDRYGAAAVETSLRDYLFVILKRKWLILGVVLVITSMAAIQQYRQPSIYEGWAQLKIEEKPPNILATNQVVITQRDPNFWGTQIKMLQNHSLALQVILTLDLEHNPNFLGGRANSGLFNSLKYLFSRTKVRASPAPATSSGQQTMTEEELRDKVSNLTPEELVRLEPYEDAITANEDISIVEKTNLVDVKYNHSDPALAQKVANTLVEVFASNNQERLESGTKTQSEQLSKQIATYERKVKDERDARIAYAKQYNLPLAPTDNNVPNQREQTYNKQLLDAQNERRKLKADYDAAKASPDLLSSPEAQKNESILKLRDKLTDLQAQRASLLQTYTAEWPEVKKLDAEIKPIEQALEAAKRQILASMESRYKAAEATEQSLVHDYSEAHGVTTAQIQHELELAAMTQNLTSDEQYLNTLNQKQRELRATGADKGTNVSVASYSRLPHTPVSPNRPRNILIALVLAFLAGIGLAFLLDFLDDTVKSLDDVDRYIHLPTLALIPAARSDKRLRDAEAATANPSTALAMVEDVRSHVAESYRHLRTSLLLSSAGQAPKTILVTSSQPSEGKTTTAINTAFMLAQTGAEVLIIDCDLRRPRLHSNFNISNVRGVTNYLSGESPLDEVIQAFDKLPNLKLLPSGPIPPNPAELLGSEQMRKLLSSLGERFAHIVVDSPPAVSFTDASILSTFVDGVILVIHSGRSSRAVVRRAKQQLLDVGAHIFGIVLNNVKLDTHGYYYGGYYGRYYYKYGYYYSDYSDDDSKKAQAASG
jgi:capsular exopolysaccharide synthesis family protein